MLSVHGATGIYASTAQIKGDSELLDMTGLAAGVGKWGSDALAAAGAGVAVAEEQCAGERCPTPPMRREAAKAIERLIALLDEIEGDPDLEDERAEADLGWANEGSQLRLIARTTTASRRCRE
jgi:hypothetical protein